MFVKNKRNKLDSKEIIKIIFLDLGNKNKTLMKSQKITPPEGYEIDKKKSTFEEIVFKPIKKHLPKSWEELEKIEGWFVDGYCNILNENLLSLHPRKNIFATEEQAQAAIALAQLSQLREVYRDGWVPNWNDRDQNKFSIEKISGELNKCTLVIGASFLSFQSPEIRDEFYYNFKDLIEEASPLLFG